MEVDDEILKQMIFIYNALQRGWCIKKKKKCYVFTKKHQNKEEIVQESYLSTFIKENSILDNTFIKSES